jgi:hypothetical protein
MLLNRTATLSHAGNEFDDPVIYFLPVLPPPPLRCLIIYNALYEHLN